ncbi:hypothetical protein M9434_005107 [Picochlorum sp. BPE23]|nr:hypothetical protein M9434_005107 [Picochlorum sp. BPE23]
MSLNLVQTFVRANPSKPIRAPVNHTFLPQKTRIHSYEEDSPIDGETKRPLVIQPKPASRKAAEPPKPVQIERSSSFLIRRRDQDKPVAQKHTDSLKVQHRARIAGEEGEIESDFNDNPIEWVLKKTDESLDAVEERVPEAAKSAVTYVTGTFGTNTSKYAVDAMKLAGKGGAKVLEVAVPASKWAISKGVGLIVKSITQTQQQNKDSNKKNDTS